MNITNPRSAVHNNDIYGTTFGSGHDIYIPDKCDQNNGFTNFPHGYNLLNSPYTNNQASYTSLSGATSSHTVKIVDYEVYKVIR
jgi:hypothetical protein